MSTFQLQLALGTHIPSNSSVSPCRDLDEISWREQSQNQWQDSLRPPSKEQGNRTQVKEVRGSWLRQIPQQRVVNRKRCPRVYKGTVTSASLNVTGGRGEGRRGEALTVRAELRWNTPSALISAPWEGKHFSLKWHSSRLNFCVSALVRIKYAF